ncbi:glycosyltransferase [uncultured Lutibacter sp.]|uniref:glycosyltransferase n=1 Tax=uncultured Lutibacter sp. TaxID=437739 RepID=UPI002620FCF6|nr:glycosyltransferase [uncultured Lutibacter sp.]
MKVVHITYSTSGGAGIAAYRLHLALLDSGVDSSILCLKNKIASAPNVVVVKKLKHSFFKRAFHKIVPIIQSFKNRKVLEKLKGTYEVATFPTTDYRIYNHPLVKKATIINLHWVGDFLNYPTFFKKCKIPVVWTLHDMNPFLGSFHYHVDDAFNTQKFAALNKKLMTIKRKSYQKSSIHTIVTPSKWLLNESQKSNLFSTYSHKHIYNGADENVFKPFDVDEVRETLKLPKNKMIFLFVSQNITSVRKGFDIIEGILDELALENILFLAIGIPPLKKHKNIHYLGNINNSNTMAKIYAASNAFLLPSREDNLPNTMVESLLCGTPVISSNTGGMKEVIKNGENGYLVNETTSEAFKNQILKFIGTEALFSREHIALAAKNKFSKKKVAVNYLNLYKSILNE